MTARVPSDMAKLTKAQQRALTAARAGAWPRGVLPTVKVFKFALGLTGCGTFARTLAQLEAGGWIVRENGVRLLA